MQFEKFYIKEVCKRRAKHLRYGQSIFNVCFDLYPKEVDRIRGTEWDCFYNDTVVDMFLDKLQFEIEHPLDTIYYVHAVYRKKTFYRLGESMKISQLRRDKL